ncbi:serine protease [Bradyrhizobium sp. NBAIM08]|uniref:S1 family peptidase n=1 Tax=Bradyrhizobium sp. NBAIM08 TaxID=2793815 RepID=UPI001CD19511|nr:serine protease [Bradyrhizobium sp. NBAIM08]MCA1474248.1 trypsin-like peptidase domain-containing protein [Bradyrhizobium sp. NBAIM08]
MNGDQSDQIGILKSLWKKNSAGVWVVHDIKGIDLTPREGFEADYFKIKDEMVLLTQRPGPVIRDFFTTFGMTEFLVRQSIVPIVAWNDGDTGMRCIGTGFFISASGLLMTAAHVIRDPIDDEYASFTEIGDRTFRFDKSLHMGVLLPANPAMRTAPPQVFNGPDEIRTADSFIAPIGWAMHWGQEVVGPLFHMKPEYKLDLDIAVCKVIENRIGGSYQPLNIAQHDLRIGDRAVAIGYAEMENIQFGGLATYQPSLVVSVGSVTNIYPDNVTKKEATTPGPCFEFDAKIPGKMSGAPILVGSGIVTKGVVSRSWQDEKRASGGLIAPMMELELATGKSLLQLIKDGSEGMAQIIGRGL